jgi:hypothetical protein
MYTTAFDISEAQGGRGAEGVDAVEGEARRWPMRWVGGAKVSCTHLGLSQTGV